MRTTTATLYLTLIEEAHGPFVPFIAGFCLMVGITDSETA